MGARIDKDDIAESIGNGTWPERYNPEDVVNYCAEDVRMELLLLRAQICGRGQFRPADVMRVLHWSNYSAKCIALIQARGMPIDMNLMLIHDGILFEETNMEEIDQAREIMVAAGRDCCDGLTIGADTDQLLENGARYRDKRPMAVKMWAAIMDVLRSIGVLIGQDKRDAA